MKKLFSLVCAAAICFQSFAQKVLFTDPTNEWEVMYYGYGSGGDSYYPHTDKYISDTVMNGKTYRHFTFGWVREDAVTKKLYYTNPALDSERVAMDYNAVAGDTLRLEYGSWALTYVVNNVDSILINSTWQHVWHFTEFYGASQMPGSYFIEGVGNGKGPLGLLTSSFVVGDGGSSVYCFSTGGSAPPFSPAVGSFDNVKSCASFDHMHESVSTFRLWPDPAGYEFNIFANYPHAYTISVYNMLGQMAMQMPTSNQHETVDVTYLARGMYFVSINDENGVHKLGKLAVVH